MISGYAAKKDVWTYRCVEVWMYGKKDLGEIILRKQKFFKKNLLSIRKVYEQQENAFLVFSR